ncbi:unnamed protein product [Pylaiella littoralis]
MGAAAHGGHLHVVQGLRARGYRWSTGICKQAAGDGHLVLLKWCLLNGCPWSWSEVVDAARGGDFADGSLDVLEWCNKVGGGEVLVDGEWLPMVVFNSTA